MYVTLVYTYWLSSNKIFLLSLFLIVNVRNKHSNKMADKSRAIVFTSVDV